MISKKQFSTIGERNAYMDGFEHGRKEAFRKSILMLQLLSSNTEEFENVILQNFFEAIEFRKIMTGGNKDE